MVPDSHFPPGAQLATSKSRRPIKRAGETLGKADPPTGVALPADLIFIFDRGRPEHVTIAGVEVLLYDARQNPSHHVIPLPGSEAAHDSEPLVSQEQRAEGDRNDT
jgi:hypothetical protein